MKPNKVLENPYKCPNCHFARTHATGEMRDGKQQYYCPGCRATWEIVFEVDKVNFNGQEYKAPNLGDTMDLQLFEIQRFDGGGLVCPSCQYEMCSLFTLAPNPEAAALDTRAICWTCGQYYKMFLPTGYAELPVVWI